VLVVLESKVAELSKRFRLGAVKELGKMKGKDMLGMRYQPLFPYFQSVRRPVQPAPSPAGG
jgi:isoleucyl-tRNA synthetase